MGPARKGGATPHSESRTRGLARLTSHSALLCQCWYLACAQTNLPKKLWTDCVRHCKAISLFRPRKYRSKRPLNESIRGHPAIPQEMQ